MAYQTPLIDKLTIVRLKNTANIAVYHYMRERRVNPIDFLAEIKIRQYYSPIGLLLCPKDYDGQLMMLEPYRRNNNDEVVHQLTLTQERFLEESSGFRANTALDGYRALSDSHFNGWHLEVRFHSLIR